VVYCVTTIRDVTSTASDVVSEGIAAVGEPDDMGSGSAREVELTRGVEDDACTTDSIMEGVLVITELAVVLATGKLEGAAAGWVKPDKPPVVEARTALVADAGGVASEVDVSSSMGE
jgi:hypothetical protein